MKILVNTSLDKKDIAKATTTNESLKDHAGKQVTIKNIIAYQKENEDGSITKIYAVDTAEAGWLMTNSPTVKDVLDVILESYEAEEIRAGIPIIIKSGKSAKNREFFFLEIV